MPGCRSIKWKTISGFSLRTASVTTHTKYTLYKSPNFLQPESSPLPFTYFPYDVNSSLVCMQLPLYLYSCKSAALMPFLCSPGGISSYLNKHRSAFFMKSPWFLQKELLAFFSKLSWIYFDIFHEDFHSLTFILSL